MDEGTRADLLDRLAAAIESVSTPHPLRVAVDGSPAAGKTTLADELALLLRTRGREVIRASAEGFQLPRTQRYRRGEFSPEANYHDSFDYGTLRRVLLDPLGPDGDRRYQDAVYDIGGPPGKSISTGGCR
jgi:uridine kinase